MEGSRPEAVGADTRSEQLVVSERRAQLADEFAIALPDAEAIWTLANMERLYAYAAEHGFPIPATMILRNAEDAVRASSRLRCPAVLKPPFRPPKWNASTASSASSPPHIGSAARDARQRIGREILEVISARSGISA
jgi:predicted ATP-grasp superfamily ATP-dependent carboligase